MYRWNVGSCTQEMKVRVTRRIKQEKTVNKNDDARELNTFLDLAEIQGSSRWVSGQNS